jgi:multidrug efflux pump subunit AcrA (membrane-fusion protein)
VVAADSAGVERAMARPVELGAAQRNRVVINSGISAGERVVVLGQNQLTNGDRVRIVGTSAAAPTGVGGGR